MSPRFWQFFPLTGTFWWVFYKWYITHFNFNATKIYSFHIIELWYINLQFKTKTAYRVKILKKSLKHKGNLCNNRSKVVDNINDFAFMWCRYEVSSLIVEKSEKFFKTFNFAAEFLNRACKPNTSSSTPLSNISMPYLKALWITCKEQLINGSRQWNPCSFKSLCVISILPSLCWA